MKDICVVIPMYGKEDYTKKCVDLTLKFAGVPVDILVVDDGSEKPFYYGHEDVFILRLNENSGFTNAVNQGILWCSDRYKYIHLLNNDTEPKPDFIKILYNFLEANSVVGIAASVRIIDSNKPYNYELYGSDLIRGYQQCCDVLPDVEAIYTHWVPLCSSLLRLSMIREIGLFDKRMKIWCSDNDYCIRANFNGWNVAVLTKSQVVHHHAVTTVGVQKKSKYSPADDQRILLEKIIGLQYAELMKTLPVDIEQGTYGRLTFEVYKK